MSAAGYVAAAYGIAVALFGAWVGIIVRRVGRRTRELSRLEER